MMTEVELDFLEPRSSPNLFQNAWLLVLFAMTDAVMPMPTASSAIRLLLVRQRSSNVANPRRW